MADNFIPNFKRSGDGVAKDLLKLKKIECISEGWYKGQIIQLMDKVAGRTIVDGVECYNSTIGINGTTSTSDQSEYAKSIRKLLKLFGMTDEGLKNIYNTWASGQVNEIIMNFNKVEDYNSFYTLNNFKEAIKNIKKLLINAHRFELIHTNKTYNYDETNRPAVLSSELFPGSAWTQDNTFYEDYIPIERSYSIDEAMIFTSISVYDELNNDITNTYNKYLLDCLKTILIKSGSGFVQLESLEKVGEENKVKLGGFNFETLTYEEGYNIYVITSKEKYNKIYNESFADNYFSMYDKGNLPLYIYDEYTYGIEGILANHIWNLYSHLDYFDNDLSDNLFYISKRQDSIFSEITTTRYITVSGLKKQSAKQIALEISKYCDFQYVVPRKKKKFLGIGGFIGNFLGGLFEGLIKVVGFISKILSYIPLYRLQMQAIGWIFTGEWTNDQDKIEQISTRMLMAAVAAFITFITFGVGWQLALSLLMSAFSMYTGLKSYDELVESIKKQNESKKETMDVETYDKLVDFSKEVENEQEANQKIYKPFEKINKTYESPFIDKGIHNPKFGSK